MRNRRARPATVWFWTYNVCFPVGIGGLALVLAGHMWAEPALIVSQLGLWVAGVMFAINVLWTLRAKKSEPATMTPAPAAAR